jgi:hypothetical protein
MESNMDGWYLVVSFALLTAMGNWFSESVGLLLALYAYMTASWNCRGVDDGMEREKV